MHRNCALRKLEAARSGPANIAGQRPATALRISRQHRSEPDSSTVEEASAVPYQSLHLFAVRTCARCFPGRKVKCTKCHDVDGITEATRAQPGSPLLPRLDFQGKSCDQPKSFDTSKSSSSSGAPTPKTQQRTTPGSSTRPRGFAILAAASGWRDRPPRRVSVRALGSLLTAIRRPGRESTPRGASGR